MALAIAKIASQVGTCVAVGSGHDSHRFVEFLLLQHRMGHGTGSRCLAGLLVEQVGDDIVVCELVGGS